MTDSVAPDAAIVTRRLDLPEASIAVWDRAGTGAPIILVHGNSCSKDAFAPLFAARALAGRRLIALDLPGCGESSDAHSPADVYTLPGLADVVAGVCARMAILSPIVVGWSLGGHVAIEALNRGANFRGLVLTGTPPCGPDPAEIAATFLPVPGAEVMSDPAPTVEALERYVDQIFAPSKPSEALRRAATRADGRMRARIFEHIFSNPDATPQRQTVARWPGPTLVLQGRGEPFFDPHGLETLAWGQLWRGACQWIDGAGHAPFYSHPDDYARTLAAFAADLAGD